jgi:hypothetical protein
LSELMVFYTNATLDLYSHSCHPQMTQHPIEKAAVHVNAGLYWMKAIESEVTENVGWKQNRVRLSTSLVTSRALPNTTREVRQSTAQGNKYRIIDTRSTQGIEATQLRPIPRPNRRCVVHTQQSRSTVGWTSMRGR